MSERTRLRHFVAMPLIGLVRVYAWLISPLLGPKCRFYPTCSAYACQALERHGPLAGLWLAARRVLACNPWSRRHGMDLVPDQFEWRAQFRYKAASPLKDDRINQDRNDEKPTL